ncbi:MAG: phosphatase PAP2 family protein [Bacteroidaceae bacterium]|nr:phosphatase PAP2 family protein [Bacteroidaceae bacterium]
MEDVLQQIVSMDTQLMLGINSLHSAFFDGFMWGYTKVSVWIPFYVVLVVFLYRNLSLKQTLWALACVALTILICDQSVSHLIRPIVQRLRPANLENPISEWVHIVNNYRGGRYSFPSAHASNTFGLAFFLMYLLRNRLLTTMMLLWAFLNCYSRIYLGVHYPGDILAGVLVGFIAASFSYWVYTQLCKDHSVQKPIRFLWLPVGAWLLSVAALMCYALFVDF